MSAQTVTRPCSLIGCKLTSRVRTSSPDQPYTIPSLGRRDVAPHSARVACALSSAQPAVESAKPAKKGTSVNGKGVPSPQGAPAEPQRPKIRVAWHAEQGLREEMEDDVVVEEDVFSGFVYAAVFDGHLGRSTVEFLKEELHSECMEHLDGGHALEDNDLSRAKTALEKAFAKTDERLLEWLEEHKEEPDSGSTATAVFVRHDRIFVAHLGDSRAVISHGGDASDLSEDHRPHGGSDMAIAETQRIKDAGGWVSAGRVCGMLAVSRAFGNKSLKIGREKMLQDGLKKGRWTLGFIKKLSTDEAWLSAHPDVFAAELADDADFLLVATDGLWDTVKSSEAVRFVRGKLEEHGDVQRACKELVAFALHDRKSDDNVSAILISLSSW